MSAKVLCILGNHLFEPRLFPTSPNADVWVFMREDRELCTHFRYHKHKIIFFLSAMRKYAEELRAAGYRVHYEALGSSAGPYEESLFRFMKSKDLSKLSLFEIEDKFFENRIKLLCAQKNIVLEIYPSPMFLTSRELFPQMIGKGKKPFMKTFYEAQRKRLGILLNEDGSPQGGRWSFDEENRKALPKNHRSPHISIYCPDSIDKEVFALVNREFATHPGVAEDFWLPTDRKGAKHWARQFFDERFELFGPYEDAISEQNPFLYHSVLTPFLNTGLVTPKDCVTVALQTARSKNIPLNSCEGFIRQVIGWREFIRGIYQNFSEVQEQKNFFSHRKKLTALWYSAETGIPPLDDVIRKVQRYGYAHHIERLMVVGSLMQLLEVEPAEAHRWFMEMFIDSSDWVMGPNVYGMALFSDGGVFATKPYICGSNYYRKMSGYKQGDWCDGVDGLYWGFINKNKLFFSKNPRMSMMARALDKISEEKMKKLMLAADALREKLVTD